MPGRLGSWVASKAKNIKGKVVETAKKIKAKVKEKVSKTWNSFTGKTNAEKAEALYVEISERYDKETKQYEESVAEISNRIESEIKNINRVKQEIYNTHFKRFMSVANRMHSVTVKGQPFNELFDDEIFDIKKEVSVSKKSDLILIDFDKFSFVRAASYIFTLGFYSRKKAKESLYKVQEEESKINEEIEKMKTQITKLKVVEESIAQIASYFDVLVKNYEGLLNRFEYGVQSQRNKNILQTDNVFNHKLDFRMMPTIHLEEFFSLFNLSIVLKSMSTLGYLTDAGNVDDGDAKQSQKLFEKAMSLVKIAA